MKAPNWLFELLEYSNAQRAAFFWVGGAAQFVEQDQRAGRDRLDHFFEANDVGGEKK